MADKKISSLDEIQLPANNSVLPIVDFGVTKKVTYANLIKNLPIATFVEANSANWGGVLSYAQFNYQGPYSGGALYTGDNLINNTDNYLPWDATVSNTDTSTFQLVNPDSPNARIWIKRTGYYEVVTRLIYFDCYNNNVSVYLDSNTASTGGTWNRLATLNRNWFPTVTPNPPASTLIGSVTITINSVNTYISVAVNPTANAPFPGIISGSTTSIFLRRIGSL